MQRRVFLYLYFLTEISLALTIEALHKLFLQSSGVSTDTRNIQPNCIFFALKGANFNGNEFAQEALDKGAKHVVVDQINAHKNTGETILCSNVLKKLQQLATYHRKQLNIPIIALTGSNGKTTTKELIHTVLSQKFKTAATKGNLNNHIGVPLTLLSMNSDTEMGIVEMGANHHKEIQHLCEIAYPDFGYITNFGKAHLEGFGSLEGVVEAKTELYRHLAKHDKTVFVNQNDPKQIERSKGMNRVSFGGSTDEPIELVKGSQPLQIKYKNLQLETHLIGDYNFANISAAIAIGDFFGIPTESIKQGIEQFVPDNNRSQLLEKNGHQILLDAYNANPTSMMAALRNFINLPGNHKVLILGDMFELGPEAKKEHQAIVDFITEHFDGTAYFIGENFYATKSNKDNIQLFQTLENFANYFKQQQLPHSQILIKGSRGMALERFLEFL